LLLSLPLAVAGVYTAWARVQQTPAIDYYQFWIVGLVVREGGTADVYSPAGREGVARLAMRRAADDTTPPRERAAAQRNYQMAHGNLQHMIHATATPLLYASVGSLSCGDYERDYQQFAAFSLALYVAAVALLCWLLGYSLPTCLLAISYFTFAFAPLRWDGLVGNVNQIQLGGLVVCLWLQRSVRRPWHHVAAGVLLGLLIAYKPNLLFVPLGVVLVRLIDEDFALCWRLVGGLAAGGALGFLGGAAYFGGAESWVRWRASLVEVINLPPRVSDGNSSLSQIAFELFGHDLAWVTMSAGLVALAAALWRGRPARVRDRPPPAAGRLSAFDRRTLLASLLPAAITLVFARLAWPHYFVLLTPLLLLTLRPAVMTNGVRKSAARVFLYRTTAMACLLLYMTGATPADAPYAQALLFDVAALLLFLLGTWEVASLPASGLTGSALPQPAQP
jgi:hypothetical protein